MQDYVSLLCHTPFTHQLMFDLLTQSTNKQYCNGCRRMFVIVSRLGQSRHLFDYDLTSSTTSLCRSTILEETQTKSRSGVNPQVRV